MFKALQIVGAITLFAAPLPLGAGKPPPANPSATATAAAQAEASAQWDGNFALGATVVGDVLIGAGFIALFATGDSASVPALGIGFVGVLVSVLGGPVYLFHKGRRTRAFGSLVIRAGGLVGGTALSASIGSSIRNSDDEVGGSNLLAGLFYGGIISLLVSQVVDLATMYWVTPESEPVTQVSSVVSVGDQRKWVGLSFAF